jgi:putative flippase GtrA
MKSHRFHFEKSDRVRFVKFALTGGLNTLVDLAVFALLTMTFSVNVYLAQVVSYGAGMLNSYTVNRSWTFHTDKGYLSPQLLKFAAANIFVMTIGMGVIYIIYRQMGYPELWAKLCSLAVTVPLGFAVNRLWVFR